MHKLSTDIINGNRSALAQAITLIESTLEKHRTEAQTLLTRPIAS